MPSEEESQLLIPQIERIARRVARRLNASPSVRQEFDADAVGHVFEVIDRFDAERASFGTWCQTVLRNHCVTLIRREAGRRKLIENVGNAAAIEAERRLGEGPPPSPLEERENRPPQIDVAKLLEERLQPLDRLLFATYAEVLSACAAETVERWCREAGCEQAALRAIEALPRSQRKNRLAAALGENIDWVRQRIYRAVQRLKAGGIGGGGG
jgi:RNA polymerase sigma factor (sigma-70 family)